MQPDRPKLRFDAVSFLNSVPLVWGMLHGDEQAEVELSFSIPSVCAQRVEAGLVDVGLVPVAEIARQGLQMIPGVGIACLGAVRSILLFSRVPWRRVRTLSADLSSRTSVQLAGVILRERFGVEPAIERHEPSLEEMLRDADAALLIGDAALRVNPDETPYECLDLGAEWFSLTQQPMVFAAWAGRPGLPAEEVERLARNSWKYGRGRMEKIVEGESQTRQMDRDLVNSYLRDYIRYEIGPAEQRGLQTFLEMARLRADARPGSLLAMKA